MFRKSVRLTTKQFEDVIKKGRPISSSLFLLRVLSGQADTRLSAVAPKKVAKTAVSRNYNRRKIYNTVRPYFKNLEVGIWIIVFSKKDLYGVKQDDITKDLNDIFIKSKLIKG